MMQPDCLFPTLEDALLHQTPGTIARIDEVQDDLSFVLFRAVGEQEGPVVWIQAAVHGDEHDGVIACIRLLSELSLHRLRGSLIVCPVANASALLAGTNASPIDGINLNRVFIDTSEEHQEASQTYSYRYGQFFADKIKNNANLFIDLHGGGQYLDVTSFAMVAKNHEQAYETALNVLKDTPLVAIYHCPSSSKGMLINEICRAGIPSILLENGGGSSWEEPAVEKHLEIVRTLLHNFESYSFATSDFDTAQRYLDLTTAHIDDVVELRFEVDGVRTFREQVGKVVKQGDLLLETLDYPSFTEQQLICPIPYGIILSIHTASSVHKGGYAVMLGKFS
ncbi:succinylglutamate desuccinylase/aspartoacylase family protein [Saccharibacillus sp. JS10]|uniref:succinylglutamate desuccinylase/aspartoacylase domain-containing protein n=1 Tax=Saccharibacillus sp. JS10 TaxID=2950552 RepID=UPI00210E645B|nr:succinylglutamate desuccinylase/aspartoacylase family protein [Saccharibacillus sp. JS10]MCQ4085444.1 succinylglutamate desuccinylase/aspartoacylase family protein [Saccharibacillus sp. JS10]